MIFGRSWKTICGCRKESNYKYYDLYRILCRLVLSHDLKKYSRHVKTRLNVNNFERNCL